MTEPWEWEEGDLEGFVVQKTEESLELDFKSCPALDISSPEAREKSKFNLSKDVSAFANSAGGTLVYGIVEDSKTHTADRLDAGYDPNEINHDWIGQVISSSRIQPRIPNVRVRPVQLTSSNPGRVAYVVHVPQSTTAHQASDKRYYKRHNFESVPMEDYEVRDTMHRALAPRVYVDVTCDNRHEGTLLFTADGKKQVSPILVFRVGNEAGAAVAQYLQTQLFYPMNMEIDLGPGRASETTFKIPNGELEYQYREHVVSPSDVPLFSGEERPLDRWQLIVEDGWREGRAYPFVLWRTRSNDVNPRHGAVMFERRFSNRWRFWQADLDNLSEGYSARFAS